MKSAVMERPVSPGKVERMVVVECAVVGCGKRMQVPGIAVGKDGRVNPDYAWKRVGQAKTSNQFFYCSDECQEKYCGD